MPITLEEALRPRQRALRSDRERADERHECGGWLAIFFWPKAQIVERSLQGRQSTPAISKDQSRRAKYRIGAVARKEGFDNDAQWTWVLLAEASS